MGHTIKPIFVADTSYLTRLFIAAVLSAALMFADHRGQHLNNLRATLATLLTPLLYLADIPNELAFWGGERIRSRDELAKENQILKDERFILQTQIQRLIALKAENAQLRKLLGTADKLEGQRLVAEIIDVGSDDSKHEIVINKGSAHGVYLGQAVIDAYGVMGQVVEVSYFTSRVLLITDPTHSIPVRVERSGERSIAVGTGQLDFLSLQYVRSTADIQQGDLLLSSGIGERFPDGYPLGTVTHVFISPSAPFAKVEVAAEAHLARTGQVLLIWPDQEASDTDLELESKASGPQQENSSEGAVP